jgi:hypothetical protein
LYNRFPRAASDKAKIFHSPRRERIEMKSTMLKAIFSDSQLWVPLAVLALGIALLIYLG